MLVSFGWTKKVSFGWTVSLLSNNNCPGFKDELNWEPEDRERCVPMTTTSSEGIVDIGKRGLAPGVRKPRFQTCSLLRTYDQDKSHHSLSLVFPCCQVGMKHLPF